MNYSFHPEAEDELEEAENHYDGIDETLGDRFRADFEDEYCPNTFVSTCLAIVIGKYSASQIDFVSVRYCLSPKA